MKNKIISLVVGLCLSLITASNCFADTQADIDAKSLQIEQITAEIKAAMKAKNKEQEKSLRAQRETYKTELRELKQALKNEKKADEKIQKRQAAEREWENYPADKKLCTAIQYNRPDLVKKVFETQTINLNEPVGECLFPLADAGNRGHKEIVQIILDKKSPLVMRIPTFGVLMSAVDSTAASREDRRDILDLLKAHGSTTADSQDGNMVVGIMAEGDAQSKRYLKEKFNIDAEGMKMGSSLIRSLKDGHLNNVAWLLENGASPSEKSFGTPALFEAVSSRELDKVKLLVDKGADVNAFGLNFESLRKFTEKKLEKAAPKRKADYLAILDYLLLKGAVYSDREK